MDITPPTVQEVIKRPRIKVNLNDINREAVTSTGFNPAASFQKELKVTSVKSVFSDEYLILEPEIPQQQQKVPKTTPSRVGTTPRGTPYEIPPVSETPKPEDFSIDLSRVRYERPNAAGKKGSVTSYDVKELKDFLVAINRYRKEHNEYRLPANDRDSYVAAIHEFFGTTPPDKPLGKGKKASKTEAETEPIVEPIEISKPKAKPAPKPTSVQLTTTTPKGPVTLKSKKAATKPTGESESEGSDLEELTSKMQATTISKKPAAKAPIRKSSESESENESESSEEEQPQKKSMGVGLAKSKKR
jgi:hypothetical protein